MRVIKELDADVLDRLTMSLHAFGLASDDLIAEVWAGGPTPGSKAAIDLEHERSFAGRETGGQPVGTAQQAALFMMVSGIDHARSFVIQLNSAAVTLALPTTVRGTLEAFARVYWLISAEDTRGLLHRHFSLVHREMSMQMTIDPDQVLSEVSGPCPLCRQLRRKCLLCAE